MRRSRYAGGQYLLHRMQWNMSEREANRRSNAIWTRLLKQGIDSRIITWNGMDNPFMTEDARKVLIAMYKGKSCGGGNGQGSHR
jgi:hypothetical protein